jgi:hypothetical protein
MKKQSDTLRLNSKPLLLHRLPQAIEGPEHFYSIGMQSQ